MANEILKDEILSNEQLDSVAGGTSGESYRDMMFFNQNYGIGFPQNWDEAVGKMGELYRLSGTKFKANNDNPDGTIGKPNLYIDIASGIPISYEEARARLANSINVWRSQGKAIG